MYSHKIKILLVAITSLIMTPVIKAQSDPGPFDDLIDNGGGNYTSPWLGDIYIDDNDNGWVLHAQHGWLFLQTTETGAVYLYDPVLGAWLYTSRDLYPYLFVYASEPFWVYFFEDMNGPVNAPRSFYSFASEDFLFLSDGSIPSIVETAVSNEAFTTLTTILTAAGLVDALMADGPFTVFAPTNDAFAKLDPSFVEYLLAPENVDRLTQILLYHVLGAEVLAADVMTGSVEMLSGNMLNIEVTNDGVLLDGTSNVVQTDVLASNGVIHVIDEVLVPPPPTNIPTTALEAGSFSTLLAAVEAAGLVDTLLGDGPFTVFAPTDDAFAALGADTINNLLLPENQDQLADILLYHVIPAEVMAADVATGFVTAANGSDIAITVSDSGVSLNGAANVVATDIMATNRVIHVIDSVILPPEDIVSVAANAGSFTTLIAAASAAGLADTLSMDGPFTVFAPTDEAFAALGQATIDDLLLPENQETLASILTYHVVAGKVYSSDVMSGSVPTLQGDSFNVIAENGTVVIEGTTNVIATDILASNGVIHVIDSVLLPPTGE